MTDEQTTAATGSTEPAAVEQAPAEQAEVTGVIVAAQENGITKVVAVETDGETTVISGIVADEEGVLAEGAIGVSGDNAIIVAAFANEDAAKEAYHALVDAEIAGRLDIEGVLVASADAEGKINVVKMTDHKTRNGFLAGAVAGAVVGIIFPPAIIASALWVGVGGAAVGKLRHTAAKSAAAKELASVMTPGTSGIIALARLADVPKVEQEIPQATAVKSAPVSDDTAELVKEAAKEAGATPEA